MWRSKRISGEGKAKRRLKKVNQDARTENVNERSRKKTKTSEDKKRNVNQDARMKNANER